MSSPESIKTLPHRWTAAWSSSNPSAWLDLYTDDAIYTDHAFQIVRQGRSTLAKHFELWRTANPDFEMSVDLNRGVFWDEEEGVEESDGDGKKGTGKVVRCSFRTINKGTNKNDLPTKKASGKKFVFVGVIDLLVDGESGLIRELEEWYTNNPFDEKEALGETGGRGREGYHTVKSEGGKEEEGLKGLVVEEG